MDDNTIPPNQDFQIPQDQGQNTNPDNPILGSDSSTLDPNSQIGSTNSVNNVNNINVSDPYDFVLQNSNPFVSSQDNPISDISNSPPNPNINTSTLLNNSTPQNQPQQSTLGSISSDPIMPQNQSGYTTNPDSNTTSPVQQTVDTGTNMNNSPISQDSDMGTSNYANPINMNITTDSQIQSPNLYNQSSDPLVSQLSQTDYPNTNSGFQGQQGYNINSDPNTSSSMQSATTDPNIGINSNPGYANQNYASTPDSVAVGGQNYSNPGYNPMNTNQTYQDPSMQSPVQPLNSMYTQSVNPEGSDNTQTQQNTINQTKSEERKEDFLSVLSYVLFINFFLIIIAFLKKDEFLKFNSIQGFSFDITFLVLFLIFNYLSHLLSSIFIIFLIIEIILFTIWILFSIFLMYKAYNGDKYKFLFFGAIADHS